MEDMSPYIIFLLRSTATQLPSLEGSELCSELDERFRTFKLVELTPWIEPTKEQNAGYIIIWSTEQECKDTKS